MLLDKIEARHRYHKDELEQYSYEVDTDEIDLLIRAVRQLGQVWDAYAQLHILDTMGGEEELRAAEEAVDDDVMELIGGEE
jgi:DUF1365 family protein